jgi:ligand-binding sensor domain-containing protein
VGLVKKAMGILLASAWLAYGVGALPENEGRVHVVHTGDVRALCNVDDVLWIGTGGGLYRYDLGRDRFVDHVTVENRLPSNSVRAIRAKGDSVLVGTDAGLVIFDGDETLVYSGAGEGVYDSLYFDEIRAIDIGVGDAVYLGTFGHGLAVMRPSGGHMITREDSLLDDKVYGTVEVVREGGEKDFYYATSMGLCAYRDSAWVGFQAGAGIPRGEVRRVLAAGADDLYLLVGVGGVYSFDGARARDLSPRGLFPGDDVADLSLDRRGILWAAGRFGGLAVRQSGHWKRIGEGDPMVDSSRWRCVYTDDEGGAFFGSADGIVVSVRDNILRKHRVPDQLPAPSARSIVGGPDEVRFLSGDRVVRVPLDLSALDVEETPPGLVALAVDGRGALWAAGRWGIYQDSGDGLHEFVYDVDSPEPSFTSLCFDGTGRLWTATRAGAVYRYDGELWLGMAEPGELFVGSIDELAIEPARDERGEAVWALARARGLAAYSAQTWTVHPAEGLGGDVRDLSIGEHGVAAVGAARVFVHDGGVWLPVGLDARGGLAVGDTVDAFVTARAVNCVAWGSGALYLGTESGLVGLDEDGVHRLRLGGDAVVDVFVDGSGSVWVGYRCDGLLRIDAKSRW